MRIYEVLLWNNDPAEGNRSNPHLDFAPGPFDADLANLANAFTRRGLVKRFWNLNGSEAQPSGPASPEAGTELTPRGSSEPTTAFWEIEPVETDPPVGRRRLAPCR